MPAAGLAGKPDAALPPAARLDARARAELALLEIASSVRGAPVTHARLLPRPDTQEREFADWFGSSIVSTRRTASPPRPLVAYHKTCFAFDQFDPDRRELGFHFGTLAQAESLARHADNDVGTNIRPAFLSLQNPLRLKDTGSFHADGIAPQLATKGLIPATRARAIVAAIDADFRQRKQFDAEVRVLLQSRGHDGIVYKNAHEAGGDSWIVFEPEQIRPALGWNLLHASARPERSFGLVRYHDCDRPDIPTLALAPPLAALACLGAVFDCDIVLYRRASAPIGAGPATASSSGARIGPRAWLDAAVPDPLRTLFAREMTRTLRRDHPRLYAGLCAAAPAFVAVSAAIDHGTGAAEAAAEAASARALAAGLSSAALWRDLADANPAIAGAILGLVDRMVDRCDEQIARSGAAWTLPHQFAAATAPARSLRPGRGRIRNTNRL